jgi:ribosomal protein S18 acetylase RimI-like enzyme
MITIQRLATLDMKALQQIISGYVSQEKYLVSWQDTLERISFDFQLIALDTPYTKHFQLEDETYYEDIIHAGLSLGAYADDKLIGIALADIQGWNLALWIHEFHVAQEYQGQGIGIRLMNAIIEQARSTDARIIVCETQNTNGRAIRFYRKMGFKLEAVDVSLYASDDSAKDEIAILMKYHL